MIRTLGSKILSLVSVFSTSIHENTDPITKCPVGTKDVSLKISYTSLEGVCVYVCV
ncbi:hypothetical protein EXN66_Car013985 [Channa argus]|uniref:Uncharacterized protein n=1 Tax=Channa argus TaxID=215402 RepID=A0A6G1Q7C1_CHAAH|nr:hypothetical protein EXN66_Car013985 [Channa argus]